MMRALSVLLVFLAAAAVRADVPGRTESSEVWNEGVGYYEQNDVTNALRVLRPLMLSKTHAGRAAEVVAKLEYELAEKAAADNDRKGEIEHRDAAAAAAQIALRQFSGDGRVERNFTRATDGLKEKKESLRLAKVRESLEKSDPKTVLGRLVEESRRLLADASALETNTVASAAIEQADRSQSRAQTLVDESGWLIDKFTEAADGGQLPDSFRADLERAVESAKTAVEELGDLKGGAYSTMCEVEDGFDAAHKAVIDAPSALASGAISQTNAVAQLPVIGKRSWQQDALDYTRAFQRSFPAYAEQYEQSRQTNTNLPPLTAEIRQRIMERAQALETIQRESCETNDLDGMKRSLEIIDELEKLLPPLQNQQNQQDQQDQQNNQDQQNDKKQQNDQNQQNQDQQQDQQQQDQDQQQKQDQPQKQDQQEQNSEQQNQDEKGEQQESPSPEKSDDEREEEEKQKMIEAILKRAQDRGNKHEQEKRAAEAYRNGLWQMKPDARDW